MTDLDKALSVAKEDVIAAAEDWYVSRGEREAGLAAALQRLRALRAPQAPVQDVLAGVFHDRTYKALSSIVLPDSEFKDLVPSIEKDSSDI